MTRRGTIFPRAVALAILAVGCSAAPDSAGSRAASRVSPQAASPFRASAREAAVRVAERVLVDLPKPPPFDWGEGVLLEGMLRAGVLSDSSRILEWVEAWARAWDPTAIDRLLREKGYCGRWGPALPLLGLWEARGDESARAKAFAIVEYIEHEADTTGRRALTHFRGQPELWVDTLFMACPLLARAARIEKRPEWAGDALHQLEVFSQHLQDPECGLFYHRYDAGKGERTRDFWGRGNGWVLLSMIEVLADLPPGTEGRSALEARCRRLLDGILFVQDPESGLWHTVLDAPETYLETSASAMFLYGISKARRVLPRFDPPPAVLDRAWRGLLAKVDAEGRVTGVSGGTMPSTREKYSRVPVGVETWGTGAFLLAAVELSRD